MMENSYHGNTGQVTQLSLPPQPELALSVREPYAWLLCANIKDIENRNWKIGRISRHGPYITYHQANFSIELPCRIYIHAGKSDADMTKEVLAWILRRLSNNQAAQLMEAYCNLRFGEIIGEVTITGCVTESDSPWFTGKYGFTTENGILYEKPIPCRGQLGFFKPYITMEVK